MKLGLPSKTMLYAPPLHLGKDSKRKKFHERFGQFKKSSYLCNAKEKGKPL